MRLIKPKVELINQEPGVEGLFKHMELCARTCYKSEDKITEDSAKKFINNVIIARGHTAMLEHGTVYLMIDCSGRLLDVANKYVNNKYSEWTLHPDGVHYCITTNYRVLLQNDWLDDLKYQCEPTEYHAKRVTVRFICDMGVAREFCRHRLFSFAQESTRYCDYSSYSKFKDGCVFIIPCWTELGEGYYEQYDEESYSYYPDDYTDIPKTIEIDEGGNILNPQDEFLSHLFIADYTYARLRQHKWAAQQARNVLPLALKTELIMTGTVEQWIEFLKLRCANDAHPQARELAIELRDRLLLDNYIDVDAEGNLQVSNRY